MPSFTTAVAAAELVPRNTLRKSIVFINEDGADLIYIKRQRSEATDVSATDHDYVLLPFSVLTLNDGVDGKEAIRSRWTCIASANTPRIAWFETEDATR